MASSVKARPVVGLRSVLAAYPVVVLGSCVTERQLNLKCIRVDALEVAVQRLMSHRLVGLMLLVCLGYDTTPEIRIT